MALEKLCLENRTSLPDLDAFHFDQSSETFRSLPGAAQDAKIAVAACMQLIAILSPPTDTNFGLTKLIFGKGHLSFATRTCLEANITEILREAGPEGLHINDIASKCGLDPSKLGRVIRYLVIHHIYREVKPDVFTNNRTSSTMDTGKPLDKLISEPDRKYDDTGFPALISHFMDVDQKCGAVGWDVLKDPVLGHSCDLTETIFSRAFNTKSKYWDFFDHPENHYMRRRFDYAMKGLGAIEDHDMVLHAFSWEDLDKGSVIVDVGGGIGTAMLPLARRYPNFDIVIQDLPIVIEEGTKFWSQNLPDAVANGNIKLHAHNFFDEQPIKNASVFYLRHVLHDWPMPDMVKILQRLRDVAAANTTLIILDYILPYSCKMFADKDAVSIASARYYSEAPEPLLPNYGAVSHGPYTMDLTMMFHYNSQEHTYLSLKSLLDASGWRLVRLRAIDPRNDYFQSIECKILA
ncbi:4-O-methyltransferase 1 [Psilocybe cubensis]|uniref:4-O-methyltransferase 1 n=1 Tax=Psilocybe cubensis TaxID=181762 RepID=A0ACB8GKA8_PSICU|nr:4-O-methyltransferase 1 [Psilocybe cubensis]KAH9475963.1 4-O-methyltransferase 1 [Psilocybe cubensis]